MGKKLTWYRVFHEKEAETLAYLEQEFDLEGYGPATVRLVRTQSGPALAFDGYFLPPELNSRNPFLTHDGKYGAVLDAEGYLWLGVKL